MQPLTSSFEALSRFELNSIAQEFLAWEAKLLDDRRFDEWYDLLDDEVLYEVPLNIARQAKNEEIPEKGFRIRDQKSHIRIRIARLSTGHAWAEMPVSRTLRMVGSVYVERTDDPGVISVESALMLYRQRGHDEAGDMIPVRRRDLLKYTSEGIRLLHRKAFLTEVTLNTPNLGVFV